MKSDPALMGGWTSMQAVAVDPHASGRPLEQDGHRNKEEICYTCTNSLIQSGPAQMGGRTDKRWTKFTKTFVFMADKIHKEFVLDLNLMTGLQLQLQTCH